MLQSHPTYLSTTSELHHISVHATIYHSRPTRVGQAVFLVWIAMSQWPWNINKFHTGQNCYLYTVTHLYNFSDAECDLTIKVFLCSLARSLKCLFSKVSTYTIFYTIKCWTFNILRILHGIYTHINWDLNYHSKPLNLKSISFFTCMMLTVRELQ